MQEFLRATEIIDWNHPRVARQAAELTSHDVEATARQCFEFVRDEIQHSGDAQCGPATCIASDVLEHRTGYCYAKSHLLAALLRANGIPAGFAYQRLSSDDVGRQFCLHGLNAIHLPGHGWLRVDPRGNKPGIDAQFDPPRERLAFDARIPGEVDFKTILSDPLTCVSAALLGSSDWKDVQARLPDLSPDEFEAAGLAVQSGQGRP